MKHFTILCCALLLGALLGSQSAAALSGYTDPCATLSPSNGVNYQGFVSASQTIGALYNWRDPPDSSALLGSTGHRQATATYHIRGAGQLEVAFYTTSGSFATLDTQGIPRLNGNGERLPLLYDEQNDRVYCSTQGNWCLSAREGQAIFEPVDRMPAGLVPYGLQAAASYDGTTFFSLAGTRLREREQEQILYGVPCRYYEVFRFVLPPGVQEVQVTLREFDALPRQEGGSLPNRGNPFALAAVSFSGGEIQIGEPTPVPPTGGSSSSPSPSWPGGNIVNPDLNSRPPSLQNSASSHSSSSPPSAPGRETNPSSEKPVGSSSSASGQSGGGETIRGSAPDYSASSLPALSGQAIGGHPASDQPSPFFWAAGGAGLTGAVLLGGWLLMKGR